MNPNGIARPKRAIALAWHCLPWPELLRLVQQAEALGYDAAFIDGDVSMLPRHPERSPLHGWTATTALLLQTQRIGIGSIRLVHHWNAAVLAHALASLDFMAPGRLRPLFSIGGRPADVRFGLPLQSPGERIAWLDEMLGAIRQLWSGKSVSMQGRYVELENARVVPIPNSGNLDLTVAGKGEQMLELIARRADRWDINLPPVVSRVRTAAENLQKHCEACRRDPLSLSRQMWLFTRIRSDFNPADNERTVFRNLNPWFDFISDCELTEAIVSGSPAECRARIDTIQEELQLDLAILDLSGLDAANATRHIELLAPGVDADSAST